MVKQLEWGISPPVEKVIAWGARAIYRGPGDVDLVHDRMGMEGGTEEQRKEFGKWLKEYGVPTIIQLTKDHYLETRERRLVTHQLHGWHISIDPKASYGYLYIGVFPVDNGDPNYVPDPVPSPPPPKPEKVRARKPRVQSPRMNRNRW